MAAKKTPKKIVTASFLNRLADEIYNTKTESYLNLCVSTLQNGPDPIDAERPMHCGLGELYFAMTGRQPNQDHVSESDVVDKAVELSRFAGARAKNVENANRRIKAIGLPREVEMAALDAVIESDDDDFRDSKEVKFRDALDNIPTTNDLGPCTPECKPTDFRKRAIRVAKQIRKAASFLK